MPRCTRISATALLEGAHERGINTAIETAGNVPWRFLEQMLPHVDTVLHDLKLMDLRAAQEVDRRRQQALAGELQEGPTRPIPDKTFIARTTADSQR